MEAVKKLTAILQQNQQQFYPVVRFNPATDKLYPFDFTSNNSTLTPDQVADTNAFGNYINQQLRATNCRYGIGGYAEHRTVYARSKHFDTMDEPRRLHLGTDIWGPSGTAVIAPVDAVVHSFAFNDNFGDYGATIVLVHQLEGVSFYTLYGHLSLNSLKNLQEGKTVHKGEVIAEFGMVHENGHWPPHLHFQVIIDMQGWKGDYPGVCKFSERDVWLANCPDADLILQLNRYIK